MFVGWLILLWICWLVVAWCTFECLFRFGWLWLLCLLYWLVSGSLWFMFICLLVTLLACVC